MDKLIEAVKAHALANWGVNGWDVVVECYGDEEILADFALDGITADSSVEEAIQSVAKSVYLWDEQRHAALMEIF